MAQVNTFKTAPSSTTTSCKNLAFRGLRRVNKMKREGKGIYYITKSMWTCQFFTVLMVLVGFPPLIIDTTAEH